MDNDKPTILFLFSRLELSGVVTFNLRLCEHLARKGYDARIILLSSRPEKDPWKPEILKRIRIESWRHRGPWLARCYRFARKANQLGPAIILPGYCYDYMAAAPLLSEDIRIVNVLHSDDLFYYETQAEFKTLFDATVCVSRTIEEQSAKLVDEKRDRLAKTIPYGIGIPETETEANSVGPLKILYNGRLDSTQKRTQDLIPLCDALHETGTAFELTIIGDGELRETLTKGLDRHLKRGKVRLLGRVDPKEAEQACLSNHALLMTSAYEGLPLSLLEGMAAGCVPVLSEFKSGAGEIVEQGINGFRFPIGDIGEAARIINDLSSDLQRTIEIGQAARRNIRNGPYSIEHCAAEYEKIFAAAQATPPTRRASIFPKARNNMGFIPELKSFVAYHFKKD